jgi:YD repeat-containing protein
MDLFVKHQCLCNDRGDPPDRAFLSYAYDAAHRLNDIQDSLGNTIHYTLDLMGNRMQEDTRDPQGTLRQAHARVYNGLNRLIKDIGAAGHGSPLPSLSHSCAWNRRGANSTSSRELGTLK